MAGRVAEQKEAAVNMTLLVVRIVAVVVIEITLGTQGSPGHSHPQNSSTGIRPKAYWVTGS